MKFSFPLQFKYTHTHTHRSCCKMCFFIWDRSKNFESYQSKAETFNLLFPHGLGDGQPPCTMHTQG